MVKNIFSVLLSVVSLVLPLTYPFLPLQLSLLGAATIGTPAFFLALEPNHERVRGRFISNVLRAALPGGITDFLLVFLAQGFCFAFDLSSDYLGTISTIVVLTVGLMVLWGVCRPFNTWHWVLWGAMAVIGYGGALLLAPWLGLVKLDLGGTLVLVALLGLAGPTLFGVSLLNTRIHSAAGEVQDKVRRGRES